MSSFTNKEFLVAGLAAAGVIGTSYLAYTLYKRQHKPERVIVIPDQWTYAGKLSNLYMYPVKSCGSIIVDKAECTVMGLRNSWLRDRVLMVVDAKNNFINARGYPQLLRVETSVEGSILTLNYEGQEPCRVDLAEVAAIGRKITVTLWGSKVDVRDCGFEAGEWLSRFLDRSSWSFHLVYYCSPTPRPGPPVLDNFLEKFGKDDNGAFPDELPYNLINEASIEDLNPRLKEKGAGSISHRNFRPNFVLADSPGAFVEDEWNFIKIGEVVFENVKPCVRCILTTMDPETGVRDPNNEPLKTLRSYRQATDEATRRAMGSSPRMGLQMAMRSPPGGVISVGDTVYYA